MDTLSIHWAKPCGRVHNRFFGGLCLPRSPISRVSLLDICQHTAILDIDITQCSDCSFRIIALFLIISPSSFTIIIPCKHTLPLRHACSIYAMKLIEILIESKFLWLE